MRRLFLDGRHPRVASTEMFPARRHRRAARQRKRNWLHGERLEQRVLLASDLWVERLTPAGAGSDPFALIDLTFSTAVNAATFDTTDLSIAGSGNPAILAVSQINPTTYRITTSNALGVSSLTIGPAITSQTGGLLDTDRDGTGSEADDTYRATLATAGITIASGVTTFEGTNLVLSGGTSTIDGPHTFASVQVLGDAMLTHSAATTTTAPRLELAIAGELIVMAGAKIDVSNRGYLPGRTSGNSTTGAATNMAGGSYGGLGFAPGDNPTNLAYGDFANPTEPGSGGGANAFGATSGGGLVRIAANSATINGAIAADGGNASYGSGEPAGSGGGILLDVGTLTGTGTITANGGVGFYRGGSGGGGRVAVRYQSIGQFDPTRIRALGGNGGAGSGAVGTVYIKDKAGPSTLRIDSQGSPTATLTPLGLPADTSFTVDSLVISGAGVVVAPDHNMPITLGSLTVQNGAVLTHRHTTAATTYSLDVVVSGALTVAAGAKIDVSNRGYLPGRTSGNSATGGATNFAGGSYGGLGYSDYGDHITNQPYGDFTNPTEPGSGGGVNGFGATSGGGLVRITAGSAMIAGTIAADGGNAGSGGTESAGSGGGILLDVGTLAGTGTITANGGNGHYRGGSGSGGRIAVYTWSSNALPSANVTALGGNGGRGPGAAGTVAFPTQPSFGWLGSERDLIHGVTTLSWFTLGIDYFALTADVFIARDGQLRTLASGQPAKSGVTFDSRSVSDGEYEARVTFRNHAGTIMGTAVRTLLVNNAVNWHSGEVAASETWSAGSVHVVEGMLSVPSGVTLTIEPGAIVKFARKAGMTIAGGGRLIAAATDDARIVLTSLADDTVGGDTNLDGTRSRPRPGDWRGFTVVQGGTLDLSAAVDLRYISQTHAGSLASSETWLGTFTHFVNGELIVPAGIALTIQPGAVVKFAAGAGITVQNGGSLIAEGSLPLPITYTSVLDDSVGGDSNGDGSATSPSAGAWRSLRWQGSAATGSLRYIVARYGGNASNGSGAGGMIEAFESATLSIANSRISEAPKDGILSGGTTLITNTVVDATDRAITSYVGGGDVSVINCTIDDNRQGLTLHGGILTVANTIVSNSSVAGVQFDFGTISSITNTNVFSSRSGAIGYSGTANLTGTNGNISADPRYRGAAVGDYRLGFSSAAIDAGDGRVAPTTDFMRAPRYDDPRTLNTGTPASPGAAIPDMGAFEFVEGADSGIDLAVTSVRGPAAAVAGDTVTLSWTITNLGTDPAIGPWRDAIYLVTGSAASPIDLLAGEGTVAGGVSLGAGQSITVSRSVTVPGDIVGPHAWKVVTNARGDVFEGRNTGNNSLQSRSTFDLDVRSLSLDGSSISGEFGAAGESRWFRFTPQAGQDIRITTRLDDTAGAVDVFVARGEMPSPIRFDARSHEWNAATATAVTAATTSQTYYVLVRSQRPGSMGGFTISAEPATFRLDSAARAVVGNAGPVTLTLRGGQLQKDMTYWLTDGAGTVRQATAIRWCDSSLVYATFDLRGVAPGTYHVEARSGEAVRRVADAISVQAANPGHFFVTLTGPEVTRVGRRVTFQVDYGNDGGGDIPIPLVFLRSIGANVVPADPRNVGMLLAVAVDGPAGILAPGARGRATVSFDVPVDAPPLSEIEVGPVVASERVDWDEYKTTLKPQSLPADAWEVIFANFKAAAGSTYGDLAAYLGRLADRLQEVNQPVPDLDGLLAYALAIADNFGEISARYAIGMFGRGSGNLVAHSARVGSDGVVTVTIGNATATYTPLQDGSYLANGGNPMVLTRVAVNAQRGQYRLQLRDGTVFTFNPDDGTATGEEGLIARIDSPNGTSQSFTYASDRLVAITDSNGDVTSITYNAAGRVTRITDPVARVTDFAYDASGEHLVSITNATGRVEYAYTSGQDAARSHAIASIELPDGTRRFFSYDDHGRLVAAGGDAGLPRLTYAHDGLGLVTITGADGVSQSHQIGRDGLIARSVDWLGREFTTRFDSAGRLLEAVGINGRTNSVSYDRFGNVEQLVGATGERLDLAYDDAGRITAVANSRTGEVTQGFYDASGNLVGERYPDGTTTTFSYDSAGRLTGETDRQGRAWVYGYDANGMLTSTSLPDGSTERYAYDSHRNLLSITNGTGVTRFGYDAADRLTSTEYPDGTAVTITYDAAGRRSRVVDQSGNIVEYVYDATGRLSSLRDGGGVVLAGYEYDSAGTLVRVTGQDGVTSTTGYTSQGQVAGVVTRNQGGATLESVAYAYDDSGWLSGVDAPAGRYSFTYDPDGRPLAIGTPLGTSRATYDERGRVISTTNAAGAVTRFTYDSLDQLIREDYADGTSVSYSYDDRRRLKTVTDRVGTTSYGYDSLDRLTSIAYPNGRSLQFAYDAFDRRTRSTDQDGFAVAYSYDALGRLSRLANGANQTIVSYAYDSVGRLSQVANGNGTTTAYAYTSLGQVARVTHRAADTSVLASFEYAYDSLQRVSSLTTREGVYEYGYDDLGQLVLIMMPDGARVTYAYDTAGNRTAAAVAGNTTAYVTNALNQYTSVGNASYEYDRVGNLVQKRDGSGTTTYGYDIHNRLVSVNGPTGTWRYEYNSFGQRIATTHDGVRTEFLIDPLGLGNVVGEYNANGTAIARYSYGIGLASQTDARGDSLFYGFDALGSTALLTTADGVVANRYEYLPFGEMIERSETTTNPFTFIGQHGVVSDGSGLFSMRHRSYDAALGRFTQPDPLGLAGGDDNPYRYAANDPIRFADPSGLEGEPQPTLWQSVINRVLQPFRGFGIEAGEYFTTPVSTREGWQNFPDRWFGARVNPPKTTAPVVMQEVTNADGTVVEKPRIFGDEPTRIQFGNTNRGGQIHIANHDKDSWHVAYARGPVKSHIYPSGPKPRIFSEYGRPTVPKAGGAAPPPERFTSPLEFNRARIAGQGILVGVNHVYNESVKAGMQRWETYDTIQTWSSRVGMAWLATTTGVKAFGAYTAAIAAEATGGGALVAGATAAGAVLVTTAVPALLYTGVLAGGTYVGNRLFGSSVQQGFTWANEWSRNNLGSGFFGDDPQEDWGAYGDYRDFGDRGRQLGYMIADCMQETGFSHETCVLIVTYRLNNVGSLDPNDIVGPAGTGAERFIAATSTLPYRINFENMPTATAAALTVAVTQTLDEDLDLTTFELGDFGFGDVVVTVPGGQTSYETRVDARASRNLYVDVRAALDPTTRVVSWTFTSLDPITLGEPEDPLAGFLPPNTSVGDGEGFVTYTIRAKSSLTTGAQITALASIVFDTNAAIATPVHLNTIDSGWPTSGVLALAPTTPNVSFLVRWSGNDDAGGSGIATYDVYVSDNGGGYTLWQSATSATSGTFTGQRDHTYRFYSVATDNVGWREAAPATADTQVTILHAIPTDILLSPATIPENQPAGSIVGMLSSVDSELGKTYTYALVNGAGDTDNASFQIVGGVLRTAGPFDFEARSGYSVRIRTTDPYGNSFEKSLTVNVTNVNEAPTGVGLATATVSEGAPIGTVVGALTAVDPDAGDTATFALVAGEGDADNVSFTVDGNQIRTATRLNFEARQSYSVRVRVTDAGGLSTEGVLTITVQDVTDEALVVETVTPPAAGAYAAGRRVRFSLTLSEAVQVRGKPKLQLALGRSTREAVYVAGNGTAVLTFEYVVGAKDSAAAVSLGRALVLGKKSGIAAGTEKLAAALPTGVTGAVATGVRFDAVAPKTTGRISGPPNGTYAPGQALDFVVRFSEAVVVAGAPQIPISGLNGARQAIYVSGSGSQALTFRYTVQSGDTIRGKKGLGLSKAIALVGGATITDEAGNRASTQIMSQPFKGIRLAAAAASASVIRPAAESRGITRQPRVRTAFAAFG